MRGEGCEGLLTFCRGSLKGDLSATSLLSLLSGLAARHQLYVCTVLRTLKTMILMLEGHLVL